MSACRTTCFVRKVTQRIWIDLACEFYTKMLKDEYFGLQQLIPTLYEVGEDHLLSFFCPGSAVVGGPRPPLYGRFRIFFRPFVRPLG
jgi:hypothetical protein